MKKKKRKRRRKSPVQIAFFVVIVIVAMILANGFWLGIDLIGAAGTARDVIGDEQLHNGYGVLFDGSEHSDTLQYLNVISMSEAFYPDTDSLDDFYFAEDAEYGYFVVSMLTTESIWNDILGSRSAYEDYFYGESEEPPAVHQIVGVPLPFDKAIKQEAIDRWRYIWDEDFLTEENFEDYFGTCYLYILPFGAQNISQVLFAGWACVIGNVIFLVIFTVFFSILMTRKNMKAAQPDD